MKNKKLITAIVFVLAMIVFLLAVSRPVSKEPLSPAPDYEELSSSIKSGQKYYEGLYKDLDNDGGLIVEYYSYPEHVYTIRHATIGGYHYYKYVGEATRAAQISNFLETQNVDENMDPHALMWMETNSIPENYFSNVESYNDCESEYTSFDDILPYHSKVCKLGKVGIKAFIEISKHDPFLKMVKILQDLGAGREYNKKDLRELEELYNGGMPMCSPISCSDYSTAFRTAMFGEIQLRLGNLEYADAVASDLIKAQDNLGAFFHSFDKDGNFTDKKSISYKVINFLLGDKPIFNGFIPTNAENMNDVLAFLMHYREATNAK